MCYHILLFTKMLSSLLQRSFPYNRRIETRTKYKVVQIWPGEVRLVYTQISPGYIWTTLYIVTHLYFKRTDIESCETDFLFRWIMHIAEMLHLELTKGTFIIQGNILTLANLACYFHRKSSLWCTLQTN